MDLQTKKQIAELLHDKFSRSKVVIVTDYKGLDVAAMNALRRKLREAEIEFKVVKNTLARLSANKVGLEDLIDYLNGPTAMAFSLADPIIGAKILSEFHQKFNKLDIKACVLDGQIYDKSRISNHIIYCMLHIFFYGSGTVRKGHYQNIRW